MNHQRVQFLLGKLRSSSDIWKIFRVTNNYRCTLYIVRSKKMPRIPSICENSQVLSVRRKTVFHRYFAGSVRTLQRTRGNWARSLISWRDGQTSLRISCWPLCQNSSYYFARSEQPQQRNPLFLVQSISF